MKQIRLFSVFLVLASLLGGALPVSAQKWQYPKTRAVDQQDAYFGQSVADPYRWLEDDNAAATKSWVEAQNALTFSYLEQIPFRVRLKQRLEELFNYPRYTAPFRNGETYYFYKNDGLQNQSVLYRQKGLIGSPEVVIDPNTLAKDGTTRLAGFNLSKDGKHAVCAISKAGSDWQEYRVMDTATKQFLPDDVLSWVKVSGSSWRGNGFYYSRYPAPEKGKELSTKNENHQVFYHRVGTPQSADELVFEDKTRPLAFNGVGTDEDERFAFLNRTDRSVKQGNAIFYRDDAKGEKEFKPLIGEIGDFNFGVIDFVNGKFLVSTNKGAKNRRIVAIDPANPDEKNWKTIVPEKTEPLSGISSAGGKLFLSYLKDVTTRTYVYDLNGKLENEVEFPGVGTAGGFGGNKDDKFVFYSFTTITSPPLLYRYNIKSRESSVFRKPEVKFDPSGFETKQVFYNSKDGTRIPMFVAHRKGLKMNGANPTLLTGYGGFNISSNPGFSPLVVGFLEAGGVYALANLRGGSEYGEKWHEAGMRFKKQNVFDDFIAAGEYLKAQKYTSTERLAIRGGSNGGLLVGAVINQRPDLCKVAIPQVGVMDMLRYQKFTIGFNWIAEYGSAEATAEDFKNLYAYSPLHNIKTNGNYPATLVTTADHDDRVVPGHSFKYTAALQEKNPNNAAPLLIRVQTNSGHGASNVAKSIEETADIYAFIFHNMGYTPKL